MVGFEDKAFIETSITILQKSVTGDACMRKYLRTSDIALIGVFCALWAALSLALGPLSFRLFGLPILCDFAVFFSLLLVTWAAGRFGVASAVGIIGSLMVLLLNPSPHIIGFAASAVVFDLLMLANHHKLHSKAYNMITTASATAVSAYFAGFVIGVFFMGKPLTDAIFWGGWHLVGGTISIVITFPIIGVLERANVGRIKGA